ncbi:MAG: magnesium chelatase [Bacteroidetes bacterium 4572_128]|nr:MAG: magnesium chelatase [Bacteroidetes bacterium 4572_128]
MLIKVYAGSVQGIKSTTITIEVNISSGAKFYLVGLPDNAVRESQQRIDSALQNNGYRIPGRKIIINMAPADIRKEGASFDLPIAIGILSASEQIDSQDIDKYIIMGELSLDGSLQAIRGVLPIAIQARKEGFKGFILPKKNAKEAAVVDNLEIYGVENIIEVIEFFNGNLKIERTKIDTRKDFFSKIKSYNIDFSDVKGQKKVKRALEIAASGGHNLIMIGAPGSGKTMLAKRMPTILPPLSLHEALDTTIIHSVAGKIGNETSLMTIRPFRAPHHTISDVALVGGGKIPQPGEISLANNGVLFLDELPEFKRTVLEVMRQPLEDRMIRISRANFSVEYPASFMLIASMNPCPCGYHNHPEKECLCSPNVVQKYLTKISGPLLDRIDIHIEVVPVSYDEISKESLEESSSIIAKRVIEANEIQKNRFKDEKNIYSNSQINTSLLRKHCKLDKKSQSLLKIAMNKLGLSARAYDRILKVSRTIADLDKSENIKTYHIAEAIQYRNLDRDGWAG